MARSSAGRAVAAVLRAASQSDTTTPSKPHSPLRMSRSSRSCSVIGDPVDTVVGGHHQRRRRPPARTPRTGPGTARAARARRCARRRSGAASPSRCTRSAWPSRPRPRSARRGRRLTAIRAVSTGSSAKHSKPRPPSGVRIRLMRRREQHVHALALASAPSAAASSRTSSGSQVAPSADEQGRLDDGLRSSSVHAAHPGRAVRCDHRPQPDRLGAARAPVVRAGEQARLVSRVSAASRLRRDGPVGSRSAVIRPVGPVFSVSSPGQETGLRCRTVSSGYGEFVDGFMNGLLADGQPV